MFLACNKEPVLYMLQHCELTCCNRSTCFVKMLCQLTNPLVLFYYNLFLTSCEYLMLMLYQLCFIYFL